MRDVVQAVRVREGARRCGQLRALARVGEGGGDAQRLEAEIQRRGVADPEPSRARFKNPDLLGVI